MNSDAAGCENDCNALHSRPSRDPMATICCSVDRVELELLYDAIFARLLLSVQLFLFRQVNVGFDSDIDNTYLPNCTRALKTLIALDRRDFNREILRGR